MNAIRNVILFETPFSDSYKDVMTISKVLNKNNFYGNLLEVMKKCFNNVDTVIQGTGYGFNFTDFECSITINRPPNWEIYNYCVIRTDDSKKFFYFISQYQTRNLMNPNTVTLNLKYDVWTNCLYDFLTQYYEKSQRVIRKSLPQYFLDSDNKLIFNPNNVTKNLNINGLSEDYYLGIPNSYDILWIQLTLDPTQSYTFLNSGNARNVNFGPITYGNEYYVFIPFRVYKSGTTKQVNIDIYEPNGFSIINPISYSDVFFLFKNTSPYILDMRFTYYPPFTWSTQSNGTIKISNLFDVAFGTNLKHGDLTLYLNEFITYDTNFNNFDKNLIQVKLFSDLHLYNLTTDSYSSNSLYSSMKNLPFTPTFDEPPTSFSGVINVANLCPEAFKYPYKFITLSFPNRAIQLVPKFMYFDFQVNIYPTAYGQKISIFFKDKTSSEEFQTLKPDINYFLQDTVYNIPITKSQFDEYLIGNRNRENTRLIRSIINNYTNISSSAVNFATSDFSDPSKFASTANNALNLTKSISNFYLDIADVQALHADLKNQVCRYINSQNNAILDFDHLDRVMFTYTTELNSPSLQSAMEEIYTCGSIVDMLSDITEFPLPYYNYIKTVDARIPVIEILQYRKIFENILNSGVRIWNIDAGFTYDIDIIRGLDPLIYNFAQGG